jgi:prevent-host-death family protein
MAKKVVNVHEAKTHPSRLLERVRRGEEIILAKNGEPYAKLGPLEGPPPREPGVMKGRWVVTDAFFEPLPEEELRAWEGAQEPEGEGAAWHLLDTHAFLWWAVGDARLGRRPRERIADPEITVYLSAGKAASGRTGIGWVRRGLCRSGDAANASYRRRPRPPEV